MILREKVGLFFWASAFVLYLIVDCHRTEWRERMSRTERELLVPPPRLKSQQTWNDLPPVVQRYFTRIFSTELDLSFGADEQAFRERAQQLVEKGALPSFHSVRFQQSGQFALSQETGWVPFKAEQLLTRRGFLWEAEIPFVDVSRWGSSLSFRGSLSCIFDTLLQLVSASVCDSWLMDQQGALEVSWLKGAVTVVRSKDLPQDALWMGEALRWLPEAALLPTVLVPQSGLVVWKEIVNATRNDQAVLKLILPQSQSHQPPVNLVVTFDLKDGWITQVDAIRPKIEGKSIEMLPWTGMCSKYQWVDDAMWVPTHMEVGWRANEPREDDSGSDIALYFQGDNYNMHYTRDLLSDEQIVDDS